MLHPPHRASPIGRSSAWLQGVALAAALLASGCYTDDSYYYDATFCEPGVELASIDTGGILILDPGAVGATAEYFGDGAWRFATACDTQFTGVPCNWQLTVTAVDGVVHSFAAESLESEDYLFAEGESEIVFDGVSDVDIDGFTLETTPGATLRVDVSLDGSCGGPFFFWLDRDQAIAGITPRVELTPSEP
jgi:hypothetical protein